MNDIDEATDEEDGYDDGAHTRSGEHVRAAVDDAIAAELRLVASILDGLEEAPLTRELRVRLRSYERVLAHVRVARVDSPQRRALGELVLELRAEAEQLQRELQGARRSA
jgi:hypothetical protein